jgi:hypothetical protein
MTSGRRATIERRKRSIRLRSSGRERTGGRGGVMMVGQLERPPVALRPVTRRHAKAL